MKFIEMNESHYTDLRHPHLAHIQNTPKNTDLDIDYLYNIFKRVLEGNEIFNVSFENEIDKADFILDLCIQFKKELKMDLRLYNELGKKGL